MPDIGLPLNAGDLPYACYPADPQTLYNDMFSLGSATAAELRGVTIGPTAPAASDQDKLWVKTSAGAPIGQFIYFNGAWVWPHEVPASGSERRMWVGSLADLQTYDGGSVGAVGAATGPFWEEDVAFRDRIPMGVGPAIALAVATNYGDADASISLLTANMAPHKHFVAKSTAAGAVLVDAVTSVSYSGAWGSNSDYNLSAVAAGANVGLSDDGTGASAPFSILNPVRALYMIVRTARIYRLG